MKTKLRNYKITRIERNHEGMTVLKDATGEAFMVNMPQVPQQILPNFLLKFRPAELIITYIYGTNIILEMSLNQQVIYHQPEKNFPEWESFFKTYKGDKAEIELAIRHYNNQAGLLLYNLHNQELDVFRFRQEILLNYYQDKIPDLVSRLKLENDLVFALKQFKRNHTSHSFEHKRDYIIKILRTKTNVPTELPLLVNWCFEEIETLEKLYKADRRITLSRLVDSKVINHTSLLIPLQIRHEDILEFMTSAKEKEQVL